MGLDPRTPGSRPGMKADTAPLSRPGAPSLHFLKLLHGYSESWSLVGLGAQALHVRRPRNRSLGTKAQLLPGLRAYLPDC